MTSENGLARLQRRPAAAIATPRCPQINKTNVERLAPQVDVHDPGRGATAGDADGRGRASCTSLRRTRCYALDAGTGRQIWHYRRPRDRGHASAGGTNRGAAVAGDRVFMVTDNAHMIALNRFTGELLWDTEMADWRKNYFATSAPLAAGNLVVVGHRRRRAWHARVRRRRTIRQPGKEVWRFWTVPSPGEPGSETWQGNGIEHGGAPTWFTGTYDPTARHRLLADRQSRARNTTATIARATTSTRIAILALDREDRQAEVALPVHAARPVGLGCDRDVRS